MKVRVRVHPGARVEKSETRGDELHVWVKAPPVDGKANTKVIEFMATLFGVSKSAVRLLSGASSRVKVFFVPSAPPASPRVQRPENEEGSLRSRTIAGKATDPSHRV